MTYKFQNIAVIGMGTMGSAVASRFKAAGYRVLTDLNGRSAFSVQRAKKAGIEVAPDFHGLLKISDIVFSIVPPAAAVGVATKFVECASRLESPPLFVDANAVSPQNMASIASIFSEQELTLVDGGIVGPPPGKGKLPRLYLSGSKAAALATLDQTGFSHRYLGANIGHASAFKMLYAGLNKGLNALLVCQLTAAHRLGLLDAFCDELADSQAGLLAKANSTIPRMPADAARWIKEMEEIAATLEELGLPPGYHQAAGEIMRLLDESPFSGETRETVDQSRTMKDTIEAL